MVPAEEVVVDQALLIERNEQKSIQCEVLTDTNTSTLNLKSSLQNFFEMTGLSFDKSNMHGILYAEQTKIISYPKWNAMENIESIEDNSLDIWRKPAKCYWSQNPTLT